MVTEPNANQADLDVPPRSLDSGLGDLRRDDAPEHRYVFSTGAVSNNPSNETGATTEPLLPSSARLKFWAIGMVKFPFPQYSSKRS